jgi:hypothetical protein
MMWRRGCLMELVHHVVVKETNHALERIQLNFRREGGNDYTKQ